MPSVCRGYLWWRESVLAIVSIGEVEELFNLRALWLGPLIADSNHWSNHKYHDLYQKYKFTENYSESKKSKESVRTKAHLDYKGFKKQAMSV